MNPDLGYGLFYVAAHQTWAWAFRARVDPWVRALASRRLGAPVIWAPATTFPLELWSWKLAHPGRPDDGRPPAYCAALCLAGAFLPVVALGMAHELVPLSTRLSEVLYLMSMPMMVLFIAILTRGREEPEEDRDRLGGHPDSPPHSKLRNERNRGVIRPKERGVP